MPVVLWPCAQVACGDKESMLADPKLCTATCGGLLPCEHVCASRCGLCAGLSRTKDTTGESAACAAPRCLSNGRLPRPPRFGPRNRPARHMCGPCRNAPFRAGAIVRGADAGVTHKPCSQPCGRPLACGHSCKAACHPGSACAACEERCWIRCRHASCSRKCGEACVLCTKPCAWSCEHAGACTAPCGAPCDR